MNQTKIYLLIAGLLAVSTITPNAAIAADATATATAQIIAPIAIAKTTDMHFGQVVSSGVAGTVVLTPAGGRSVTGGVTLGNATSVAAASFSVTGEGTNTYAITLPSADVTLTSGANTMTANTFTSTPSGTGTLTAGAQTLTVGATLNVGVSQASGTYVTGTAFTVTVAYN